MPILHYMKYMLRPYKAVTIQVLLGLRICYIGAWGQMSFQGFTGCDLFTLPSKGLTPDEVSGIRILL